LAMIFKRGKTYWFEFRFNNQRVRMSTHQGNGQVARDAEAAERMRLVKGEHGISRKDARVPTLEAFKPTFVEWVRSEKDNERTRDFYDTCYKRLCEFKPLAKAPLDKIDEATLETFKLWALQSATRTTVNRYLATLKKALRYAWRKRRLIDRMPVIELYPHERGREYVYSDAAYENWLDVAPEPLRSASVLAHDGGICRGELLALRRDCVVLTDASPSGFWGTVQIRRGLKRDARKRDIPITKDMALVLHEMLATSQCAYVFTSPANHAQPLSRNTLADQHRRMMKTGEFDPDAGLHALRHTFLTEAARHTQNVRALQILAGHANIATTMRYVHPDAADVMEIAQHVQEARAGRIAQNAVELPTKSPTVN
jgi:integrase